MPTKQQVITGIVAAVVLGVAIGGVIHWRDIGDALLSSDPEWQSADTLGEILVDSPEVYTRERLVNDRFTEGAWLKKRLANSDEVPIELAGVSQAQRFSELSMGISRSVRAGVADEATDDGDDGETSTGSISEDKTREELGGAAGGAPAHGRSAIDSFRDRQAYREEIRSAIIENQLDDRHDFRHTTLYKLKFDASVLPAIDHDAWGVVEITVTAPLASIRLDEALGFSVLDRAKQFNAYFQRTDQDINAWYEVYQRYLKKVSQQLSSEYSSLLIQTVAAFDSFDAVSKPNDGAWIQLLDPRIKDDLDSIAEYINDQNAFASEVEAFIYRAGLDIKTDELPSRIWTAMQALCPSARYGDNEVRMARCRIAQLAGRNGLLLQLTEKTGDEEERSNSGAHYFADLQPHMSLMAKAVFPTFRRIADGGNRHLANHLSLDT